MQWFLVIDNLKRLQSLCKKFIFNLEKLFLDGFHGYTCQMLDLNNYSGYKTACTCVKLILKVRFPRLRRCHLGDKLLDRIFTSILTV